MDASRFLHIYNRGVDRRIIFIDDYDYNYFLMLIERLLDGNSVTSPFGYQYPNASDKIRLLAYCLMPNHFHFFIEEIKEGAASRLMQSLKISYAMYFNKRYRRTGVLFETKYRSKEITDESYFLHISRYIHLNALAITRDYPKYKYSSMQYYLGNYAPDWLDTERLTNLFLTKDEYITFHKAYELELAAKGLAHEKI